MLAMHLLHRPQGKPQDSRMLIWMFCIFGFLDLIIPKVNIKTVGISPYIKTSRHIILNKSEAN